MNRPHTDEDADIVHCTARIVMGYVAGNRLPPDALVTLIMTMSRALRSKPVIEVVSVVPNLTFVASDHPRQQAPARRLTYQEIENSIHERFLVCFEDGMRYRMLSRHLRLFGLTPNAYRAKWCLPDDYTMMPVFDLEHRAELARQRNLGQYDRSTAKPRKKYVYNTKVPAGDSPAKKAYSTEPSRGGWPRQGGMAQTASPG